MCYEVQTKIDTTVLQINIAKFINTSKQEEE